MPPKAKDKPKKLTRKEILELQKEEQRKKDEEERIRQEEEDRKRQELERLRKIEEERLAAEERARLNGEEVDNEIQKGIFKENLDNAKKSMKQNEDWEKFLLCTTKPDSVQEAELTTFITTYKESKSLGTSLNFQSSLENIQYSEKIVQEINQFITQLISEQKETSENKLQQKGVQDDQILRYQDYIKRIREVSLRKLDEITANLVINTDTLLEEKQAEMQKKINEAPQKGYKQDEKHKQEIFKIFPPMTDFKYGLWINPNSKSGYRHKPIDFTDLEIQCEVPRTLMSTMLIMKISWTAFDFLSDNHYMKDITVGGVLDIECLEFLQLPKKVNNWTLKMTYDIGEAIKRYSYPALDSAGQVNYQSGNPVKVYYTLPSYIWIHPNDKDKMRVGVYDKQSGNWQTECIDEVKYDSDKKLLTFNTLRLAPFACLQERCVDFPYQKWKLRCVANDKAILDIVGKRETFRFEIHPGHIVLIDQKAPEFQHLVNKKMLVGAVFYELQRCGVNFLPMVEDAHLANIVVKDRGAEELAIKDLSEAVRSFYIESSRWNNSDTGETVVAKIKENLEFDEDFAENQEKDWKTVRWWFNKCAVIQARDSYTKCISTVLPQTTTHCNLEVTLKTHNLTTSEALLKMKDLHYVIFIDTVAQVLRLTKLLAFTVKD